MIWDQDQIGPTGTTLIEYYADQGGPPGDLNGRTKDQMDQWDHHDGKSKCTIYGTITRWTNGKTIAGDMGPGPDGPMGPPPGDMGPGPDGPIGIPP